MVAAASVLLLTGCATQDNTPTGPNATGPAAPSAAAGAEGLLSAYGLAGKNTQEVIDHLDRLGIQERPADLRASVRPDGLVLSARGQEVTLDIPDDRFYLSVAPYVERTHDCFYHSLTTCRGELAGQDLQVKIVDETTNTVLVDEVRTTFANGFVGFWLPRDIDATLRISYGGKVGETKISTDKDAPTCLTTLRLT
jgi:hypothetical protein